MKPPFPYQPLSAETLSALAQIERATTLKGLDPALETVRGEALRRGGVTVLIGVLIALPLSVAFVAAYRLGWIGVTDAWQCVFVSMLAWGLTPVAEFFLRGPRRMDEELRLRSALNVWKVLARAEKAT